MYQWGCCALYFIAVTCCGTEREERQLLVFSCPSIISTEHIWSHYLLSQVYHGQQLPGLQEAGKGEDGSGTYPWRSHYCILHLTHSGLACNSSQYSSSLAILCKSRDFAAIFLTPELSVLQETSFFFFVTSCQTITTNMVLWGPSAGCDINTETCTTLEIIQQSSICVGSF